MYGVAIVGGILGIMGLVGWAGKRRGLSSELVWEFLPWVIVGGVVGARLYHVIDLWRYYLVRPVEVLLVWHGGLGIYGAIVGAVGGAFVGYWWFIRQRFPEIERGLSKNCGKSEWCRFVSLLDIAALGIPLGQAIGRWGNYFNQELYGPPTNLPWGIWIEEGKRLVGYEAYERFHPLFLYEALWSLLVLVVLWGVELKVSKESMMRKPGMMFGLYLVGYAVGRMGLELFRLESWQIGGVPTTWWVGAGILLGYVFLVSYYSRRRS